MSPKPDTVKADIDEIREKYTCPKCGSHDAKVQITERRMGVYCNQCGARLMFVKSRKQLTEIYKVFLEDSMDMYALKMIRKTGNNTIIRCECCGCLLYSSVAGKPQGQFDLLDANFCPSCGAEFLDAQKNMWREKGNY